MVRTQKFISVLVIHAEQILILVLAAITLYAPINSAGALDLLNRKVTIGTSRPSQITTHTFNFDIASSANVGSIEFEYCINSPIVDSPCVAPPGLDASSVVLSNQSGETGFSIHPNTNAYTIVITRAPSGVTPQPASYEFSNIMNPSSQMTTFYVRVQTFPTDDATGSSIDAGAVAFATTNSLEVTAFVPPFLTFCVGITVADDCSTTVGDFIDFGELLRTLPSAATSQFAGATNDVGGYFVSVHGNTMTSGSFLIPPLAANGPSVIGTSQYGLNLRQNSAPSIGQEPSGIGTAITAPDYAIPNSFRFVSGETLAESTLSTDYNKFTVSYLINVSTAQQPGVYAATMTYVATASF